MGPEIYAYRGYVIRLARKFSVKKDGARRRKGLHLRRESSTLLVAAAIGQRPNQIGNRTNPMAIKKTQERFSKPGKGIAQVEQLDSDGKPVMKDGKPVVGNEQYLADQLTDDSVDSTDIDTLNADQLEACNGDLAWIADCFREGWNRKSRIDTAATDPYEKAAKNCIKLKLKMAIGADGKPLELAAVIAKLRKMDA